MILIACEESGIVRRAFRRRGFNAWSCDVIPSADGSPFHIQDDVFNILDRHAWLAMLAFWPCTRLCLSGVHWLDRRDLWDDMYESAACFRRLLEYDSIPLRALENPIPHRYAVEAIGANYDHLTQPWKFGHEETKATCFWLRGLKPLRPTKVMKYRFPTLSDLSPKPDRAKIRSRTFPGIAEAMANQWGDEIRRFEAAL